MEMEYSNDSIICPYCGHEEKIELEMFYNDKYVYEYEEGEVQLTCPVCEKEFKLAKRMEWVYETEGV